MASLRLATLASLVTCLALAFTIPGCAADDGDPSDKREDPFSEPMEPVLVKEAVTADQDFANDVEVKEDRLVIATAGHEAMIAKIQPGAILAGNRSLTKTVTESENGDFGPNPFGFLRRVTKVEEDGPNTVIHTEQATLDEWLQEGDIDFSDDRSLLDGSTPIADESDGAKSKSRSKSKSKSKSYTQSLKFLANDNQQGRGSGSGSFSINGGIGDVNGGISLSNATFRLNARFDGHFKVRYKELRFLPDPPTAVNFKAHLTLDPVVSADIDVTGGRTTGTIREKEWRGRGMIIPIAAPIPITLYVEPELKCSLSYGGSVSVSVSASINAHAEIGFQGDAGFKHFDLKNLSKAPSVDGSFSLEKVTGKASLSAECKLLAVPTVLAFDAAGLEGKIGPYVSVTADLCAAIATEADSANGKGITIAEEHGLAGEFNGRIQIPLIRKGKSFTAASLSIPLTEPNYLLGDDKTCDTKLLDSCKGKADGFYCSEIAAYSGYYCKGEQIVAGMQCTGEGKKCVGGTEREIRCE